MRHIGGMKNITRRGILSAAVAAPFVSAGVSNSARAASQPVLVELFTSQGCSSCPAADKLAGQLAKRDDVIIVSLNVDYWDYLGWKDTLAKPEFTKRQMDYAHARGDGKVYTPQMVINGGEHVVGSSVNAASTAIAEAARGTTSVKIAADGEQLRVTIGAGDPVEEATVWLMAIAPQIDVKIERGENAGTTVTYHRVVRNLVPAGMWQGKAAELLMPRTSIMTHDSTSCLAVLQFGTTGNVIGLDMQPVAAA